ncbi:MAG: hypothetical protein AAGM38_11345 [Pseudomonadota bacterium]
MLRAAGRALRLAMLCLAISLVGGPPRALATEQPAPRIWMHDALGRLGVLDLETGAFRKIAVMTEVLTDLAFAPDGRLFGISFSHLYEVARDGDLRRIGRHGVPCGNALEIGPDGVAYAMGCSSDGLYALDLESGDSEQLFGVGFPSSGDLAWRGGALMLAARDGASDALVEIDVERGRATMIGAFGVGRVYGLVTGPGGRLYAGSGAQYFEVDAFSGRAHLLGAYAKAGFSEIYGWAIETSFEPGLTARRPPSPQDDDAA